jgi:tetratricopeptide (TPR) repeat protein
MIISKEVRAFARFSLYGLAIFLVPIYLIRHFVYPSESATTVARSPIPMTASFKAPLEKGKKLFQDGLYADALLAYQEAEKSVSQLNDTEYEALKEARLQVAHAYESTGDTAAASKSYVVIVSCAIRESKRLSDSKTWDKALARARDAEQFAPQIAVNQRLVTERAMEVAVTALRGAQSLDAAQEEQHLIDYLESSGDRDELLARAYANLGSIYTDTQQWDNAEQALVRAAEICGLEENRRQSAQADYDRNFVDYQLVTLYLQSGKTDLGLARADEYYLKYKQNSAFSSDYMYPAGKFASLGLAMARRANQPDAISLWERRSRGAS